MLRWLIGFDLTVDLNFHNQIIKHTELKFDSRPVKQWGSTTLNEEEVM